MDDIPRIRPDQPLVKEEESGVSKKEESKVELKKKNTKIFVVTGIFLLSFFVAIVVPSVLVYGKARALYKSGFALMRAVQAQDLPQLKDRLQETKTSLLSFQKTFNVLSWTRWIPFLGGYTKDIQHSLRAAAHGLVAGEILIDAIEPYADIIGFTGSSATEQASDGQKTAQDRVDFVIKSIPDIIPKADKLSQEINAAKEEIDQINPSRYPVKLGGKPIREKIKRIISLVDKGAELVTNGKPLLEAAPYLLGTDEARTYLILFQNDKELRPTGGFITAYSIAKVENGKFKPVASSDIYNLDDRYRPTVSAPEPIVTYLKGPYVLSPKLRLRDMNWSPDFAQSMELFIQEVKKVGIDEIDGIIAVDTEVLVNLLDVLGQIGVPGYGNFSTEQVPECKCPQVVYELESFADIEGPVVWSENEPSKIVYAPPNYDNRKKIIGPLTNSILANALGQPKDKLPDLLEAVYKSLVEKHVLFYLFDAKAQAGVESFGIAGRIKEYGGDYLHINDANLGGRKSNLYVTQEVVQNITIAKDGTVEKEVTITYKNPEKHDGWLNSVLPNWVRIYVPKGSQLIDFAGVEEKVEPYEEFGKTVFAGFFELRPQGMAKVTVRYRLPYKMTGDYRLLIQKQPGTDAPLYSLRAGKYEEELFLKTDKEFRFRI
jgi:hypothetical protein